MPVADALAAILAGADPLPEEMAALDTAYHRVLAHDVAANIEGARARGLAAVHVTSTDDVATALSALGIAVPGI